MFRPRLRSSGGCVRCRGRRSKCDEGRPSCSFCRRWGLVCSLSGTLARSARTRVLNSNSSHMPSSQNASEVHFSSIRRELDYQKTRLDPFHTLPICSDLGRTPVTMCLHQFFQQLEQSFLPFENTGLRNEATQGWIESAMLDQTACYAFLQSWASHQPESAGIRSLRLRLENRTVALLRDHVGKKSSITEEILLAASIHYMTASKNIQDVVQHELMLCGITALVDSCGGHNQIVGNMRVSTIFAVQYTDILYSLISADRLRFVQLDRPNRPQSFQSVYERRDLRLSSAHTQLLRNEVLEAMEDIDFLLYFRIPSRQARGLTHEEIGYIHSLEYWVNYNLCLLQHEYADGGSVNEIMVVSLIIVKAEIVAEASQHMILVVALLRRLKSAILSCDLIQRTVGRIVQGFGSLAIWACFVAASGAIVSKERIWFLHYIRESLVHRYGSTSTNWPANMETCLRNEMQQFAWHTRLDISLFKIVLGLRTNYLHCRDDMESRETVFSER